MAVEESANERTHKEYTLDVLRHERKIAAQRKRRIVFNNDGDELWRDTDATRAGVLAARIGLWTPTAAPRPVAGIR